MNKEKIFYDIINWIMVLLIVIYIVYFLFSFNKDNLTLNPLEVMGKLVLVGNFINIYVVFYTIAMIVLAIRREKSIFGKIIFILFSLILVGIAPLLYYFFGLRKNIPEKEKTQMNQQAVQQVQESPTVSDVT